MSTYGTRDATQFELPSVEQGARYYTLIDSTTGQTTLKKIDSGNILGLTNLDVTMGTIDASGPNKGKFIPNPNGSLSNKATLAFRQPQTLKTIKNKAEETTTKALVKSGKSIDQSKKDASTLLATGKPAGTSNPVGVSTSSGSVTNPVDLKIISSEKTKKDNYGSYRYPLDLDKSKQDKIKFNMLRYAPRTFTSINRQGASETFGGLKEREGFNQRIVGSVILPIPSGISETNGVSWGDGEATPFELLAQNTALSAMQKGIGAGVDVLGGAAAAAQQPGTNQDLKTAITSAIAESATQTGGLLSRTQGAIINPNLELLFKGLSLRPFNFTFKMSARSQEEAKEIIKIIRFFKQGMSPQKSQSNLFVKAPNTFKIQYIYGQTQKDHPFIGGIKECALQSLVVNYTPEGQYATFWDGPMISYEIQMTLQELEPVFNDDYGADKDLPANLLFQ